jgi:adenosylhomocysteinase
MVDQPGYAPGYEVADLSLAEAGVRRIGWADRAMPVLRAVRERFAAERPFRELRIAACLQVTAETAGLVRALAAGGAEVTLAASNPLSTQDDTAAALVSEYGIGVYARAGIDHDGYYRHLDAVADTRPHLVIDEGGDLVNVLHTGAEERAGGVLAGCEGTTTGVIRLRQMEREGVLRFPVAAVNDTPTKRMLDNRYGTGQSTFDAIMRATGALLAGRTVVICGYGYCGTGLAERARGLGARVVVTEVDPVRALDAVLQGFTVLPVDRAAVTGDVFVTATGGRDALRAEHFAVMRDGAILVNAGHFDVEIDVAALGDLAVEVRPGVRPHVDEYLLPDGRALLLVAEGRVANLTAAEGNPAQVMDIAFTTEALTAAWLAHRHTALPPTVHDVPADLDREVADLELAALGVAIDTLTQPQRDYLTSWRQGTR